MLLRNIPLVQMRREVDFLARHLPLPEIRHVLDICCCQGEFLRELCHTGGCTGTG